jgi:hypothetical protein
MGDWLVAVLIGAGCGLALGIKIARGSLKVHPIQSGILAQAFHYLACAGLTSVLPFVLVGVVVGVPALKVIGTGVGFLALSFVFLLCYAVLERSASASSPAQ